MNTKYELAYLEPDDDSAFLVTVSDEDYRLDIFERVKQHNDFTRELEKLTRNMMLSAGRLTATLLHSDSEAEKHLSNVEKFTKELRELLNSKSEGGGHLIM